MKQNIPPCSATLAVQGIVDPNRIQSLNVQINCSAFWQSIVDWSWNETRKVLVWLYTNPATKASLIKTITSYQHFKSWQSLAQFCGILPTFLSLEAHQGKIFSYVTAIWRPKWVFSSLLPQRNVSHSTILGTSAWLIQTPQPPLVTWRRSSCWIWAGAVGWTRSVCWNFLGHINFIKIFIWLFIKWKNVQSSSLEEAMVIHVLHNWQSKGW